MRAVIAIVGGVGVAAPLALHRLGIRGRVGLRSVPRWLGATVFGALAGFSLAGWVGAAVGVVAVSSIEPVRAARARRRRADLLDDQIPRAASAIAAACRSGANLPQAVRLTAIGTPAPLGHALGAATAHLDVGGSLAEALDRCADNAGTAAARLLCDALAIGRAAPARLPDALDSLARSMTERRRIARDRRAATSQARLSALIVACLPVAFYGMVGSGARQQMMTLLRDPAGWMLLGAGFALEAAGLAWMRRLTKERA